MDRKETNENVDSFAINVLSLCSGIGGLDIGFDIGTFGRSRTVCFVEREAFAAAILAQRMAEKTLDDAPIWSDLHTFNGRKWRGVVDCIIGGYPCQPFSHAGKRHGANDERHLWPSIVRIIEDVQPTIVFFENVSGHLTLGFDTVCNDLERLGFNVAAGLFTAEEVGAPHRRERLFILGVADTDCKPIERSGDIEIKQTCEHSSKCCGEKLADTAGELCKRKMDSEERERLRTSRNDGGDMANANGDGSLREREDGTEAWSVERSDGTIFPPGPRDLEQWQRIIQSKPYLAPAIESKKTEPGVCGMDDGPSHRVDRLRACGNAVVPLVAAYAFTTLFAVVAPDVTT